MKRLSFELPEFIRISWVSETDREVWEPRIDRIIKAWREVEWLSVAEGIRQCATISVSPEYLVSVGEKAVKKGLFVLPLGYQGVQNYSYSNEDLGKIPTEQFLLNVVIGKSQDVLKFKSVSETANEFELIGKLVGYPPCCQEFFRQVLEEGNADATWSMAVATTQPLTENNVSIEITISPFLNLFWRWLSIRPIPHFPCSFNCKCSLDMARNYISIGRKFGYSDEMDWLLTILSWPVQWSALHGIAEIKTPILKISTKTDATSVKYTVRCLSDIYPAEGVKGLYFPYRTSASTKFTQSMEYQRGLNNLIKPESLPSFGRTPAKSSDIKIMDTIFEELRNFHGSHFDDLNIAKICTGDYFTVVELTNGNQGVGSNLLNMHGPHHIKHDYISYDQRLLKLSNTDKLLKKTILDNATLSLLGKSVKIAILNALSCELLSSDRLSEHNLHFAEDFLGIVPFIKENDIVTMIGCMGNYSSLEVGKIKSLKQIYFSDFEYIDPFKEYVESFVSKTFCNMDKVIISDGSENKTICESANVVIITSDTLCTDTLDNLLQWSKNAREIIIVGWCYAMDPLPLFARGVSALTLQQPVRPNLVNFIQKKLCKEGPGYTDSFIAFFKRGYICAKNKAKIPGFSCSQKYVCSRGYQQNLYSPIEKNNLDHHQMSKESFPDTWYYTDNGFGSRRSMDVAHKPLEELAVVTLSKCPVNVLDLGCGNGALLQKIRGVCPDVEPFGIDVEPERIGHARMLLPEFGKNFIVGDVANFDSLLPSPKHYALVLLSLCRIKVMSASQIAMFGERVQDCCDNLLVYDYYNHDFQKVAYQLGLELIAPAPSAEASLARFATRSKILTETSQCNLGNKPYTNESNGGSFHTDYNDHSDSSYADHNDHSDSCHVDHNDVE